MEDALQKRTGIPIGRVVGQVDFTEEEMIENAEKVFELGMKIWNFSPECHDEFIQDSIKCGGDFRKLEKQKTYRK